MNWYVLFVRTASEERVLDLLKNRLCERLVNSKFMMDAS